MSGTYKLLAPWLIGICETALLLGAGIIALRPATTKRRQLALLVEPLRKLSRRKSTAILFVGFSVLLTRAALIPVLGIPAPRWNDEFGYLLTADTFAHGRLTNPTHPMWVHFETIHVIEHPTYMSLFPPAQGLVLAAGQLAGQPWIGQLLITALMCASVCWALQGWLPPGWALFGASLAALRLGILSYWMNTYFAASIVALGGALMLGALPRLKRSPRIRDAVLMGTGLVILANSRPYEGLIYSVPFAIAMLFWLTGAKHPPLKVSLTRVIAPLLIVLAVGGLGTGYYYKSVTGDPFRMTYQVNRAAYATARYFLWQSPRPEPVYHHQVLRDLYDRELREFEENRTLSGYIHRGEQKFVSWWWIFLGPAFTLPLLAWPWAIRRPRVRFPTVVLICMFLGFSVQTWTLPHYFAPATAALYLVVVQCARHLYLWAWRGRVLGPRLVAIIPLTACALIVLRVAAALAHAPLEPPWPRGNLERAQVVRELGAMPGHHLVIVRYGPEHDLDREWVWNDAEIDPAKIVWARDMGDTKNQELLDYFQGRRVWQVNGDDPVPVPKPYAPANGHPKE